jgi:alkanesulfonate monooxygenase SsuD/methylene tetrahydromethanopterin reductase-like flavin-dependent oxidoreductase (luciferase family)
VTDPAPSAARLGVVLPAASATASAADYIRAARVAEEIGYDSVFCGDHLFGTLDTFECLTLLAAIAAATERVRVGATVLVLPLREPAVTAKQIATIDRISEGRFILGVGPGGERPEEFAAVGKAVAQRGRLTDEALATMAALWTGEPADVPHAPGIAGQVGSPAPGRKGGPPIWIGGRSDAALERALRHDGWCAYATSPRTLARHASALKARKASLYISVLVFTRVDADSNIAARVARDCIFSYYGQDWTNLLDHVAAIGTTEYVARRLGEYRAAGADEIVICPLSTGRDDLEGQLRAIADLR